MSNVGTKTKMTPFLIDKTGQICVPIDLLGSTRRSFKKLVMLEIHYDKITK